MKKEKHIEQLFQEIYQSLRNWGMSNYSVRNYHYEGVRQIRLYYDDAEKTLYDEAFTTSIVDDLKQKHADGVVSECIYKSVCKIAELIKTYDGKNFVWKKRPLGAKIELNTEYYCRLLDYYRDDECRMGLRTVSTINNNITLIRHFFRWLERNSIGTLEQLALKDVGDFLTFYGEQNPCNIGEILGALRKLCAFIKRQDISSIDFYPVLTVRPAKRRKLMPVYNQAEADEILSAVDRTTPLGKRNYAILIIAKELGVRSCDIANLKLDDIRWENNEIRFIQAKTGTELVLPLEPVVGNAIAEYILEVRPKTDSPHIFVRSRAPHVKMTAMTDVIKKYAPRGKFEKFSGFHSFRRGLASQMLNAGIAADTVKGVLGHTKIDSLKPYARISDVRLKSCAMSLSGIETTREALI